MNAPMASKTNFLIVCGLESSGNRLLRSCLLPSGYQEDDDRVDGWWDGSRTPNGPTPGEYLLTLRSLPHGSVGPGRHMPNVLAMADMMEGCHGWEVSIAIAVRDQAITLQSRITTHLHGDYEVAQAEQAEARLRVVEAISCWPWAYVFSYEAFMFLGVDYLRQYQRRLRVPRVNTSGMPTLNDANRKYYPTPRPEPVKEVA